MSTKVYNRLFTKILDSSIWLEPDSTRIVWMTLLATMNEEGYCHFSAIQNLASRARVSVAKAKRAIACFEAPDPDSENLANEGRRIERVPGGYIVLNAGYYRAKFSREIEKEQTRIRVAKHRAKQNPTKVETPQSNKSTVTEALHSVSPASDSSSSSESVCTNKKRCTEKEAEDFCVSIGLPASDGAACFHKWEGNGWTNGGKPIQNWRSTIQSWKLNKHLPSQRLKPQETNKQKSEKYGW